MEDVTQFSTAEVCSIQTGLEEIREGRLVFDLPAHIKKRLRELWSPAGSSRPRERIQLEESAVVYDYASRPPERPSRIGKPSDRMSWSLALTDEFNRAIQNIDRKLQGRILQAIGHLSRKPTEPLGDTVKPLTGDLKGLWRYRLGDYRLVYQPDSDGRRVVLVTFTARSEAYQ